MLWDSQTLFSRLESDLNLGLRYNGFTGWHCSEMFDVENLKTKGKQEERDLDR
jgi:hypothetical protein